MLNRTRPESLADTARLEIDRAVAAAAKYAMGRGSTGKSELEAARRAAYDAVDELRLLAETGY